MGEWTFLTNHALVLLCVARDPDVRLRTVADCAGITERAAHRIMTELVEAGYLTKHRLGRRNFYEVHAELPMRHPLEEEHQVSELLKMLLPEVRSRDAVRAREGGVTTRD
jgi:DNA-binding IclR family transcriptional regulator